MTNEKKRTTMSVREMGDLLGLRKTETYWLIHKNAFTTLMVDGKMRIDIESFEHWYENQTHYHKVTGEKPGQSVSADSYSIQEIADMLGLCKAHVYDVLIAHRIKTIVVDHQKRVLKKTFEMWHASQSWYRTPEDRERDCALEEASISMPEFGRMLNLDKRETYVVIDSIADQLDFVVIADRRRITKESFERWYASQSEYVKITDRSKAEQRQILKELGKKKAATVMSRINVPVDKLLYTPREISALLDVTEKEVYNMIKWETLKSRKINGRIWISRESLQAWLDENDIIVEGFMEG